METARQAATENGQPEGIVRHHHDAHVEVTLKDEESCDPNSVKAEEVAEFFKHLRLVLDSAAVGRVIEIWGKRIECEPDQTRLRHELRVQVQRDNAKFYHTGRWFFVGALVICLAFIGVVIFALRDNKDALLPVLTAVIGLLAGAGGGWIFGQRPRREN